MRVLTAACLASIALIGVIGPPPGASPGLAAQGRLAPSPASPAVEAFDLLSAENGWVLAGGRLWWTRNGGQAWQDITPAADGQGPGADLAWRTAAVSFPDPENGFAILTSTGGDGVPAFALARTADGGRDWQIQRLSLFPVGDPASFSSGVTLQFLDALTGWLTVRQATGSNFRTGTLFQTGDGGATWRRMPLPGGGPVYFVTAAVGWSVGGPSGDELYRTEDAGQTWSRVSPPHPPGVRRENASPSLQLPAFFDGAHGVLAATAAGALGLEVSFYTTSDQGQTWRLIASLEASGDLSPGVALPLAATAPGRWLSVLPNGDRLLSLGEEGEQAVALSQGPLVGAMRSLDMATASMGWAYYQAGACDPECHQHSGVLRTEDGGRTWSPATLPGGAVAAQDLGQKPAPLTVVESAPARTRLYVGQGFDKCEAATLGQLEIWRAASPYRVVNLYIGGANRACDNYGLTPEYVAAARAQGWRFIPTWVGPQAACWGGHGVKMSYDPVTAHAEGEAEAEAATAAAQALGLAGDDGAGTVLYYDLEAYDISDPACRLAASAFVDGWTEVLQATGHTAGMYGACYSAPYDWVSLPHVPDALWIARWTHSSYDPSVTVWGVYCLGDDVWSNHQRIKQYTGGHSETWGGITLNVDCDVADGIVADPTPWAPCEGQAPCWLVYLPLVARGAGR